MIAPNTSSVQTTFQAREANRRRLILGAVQALRQAEGLSQNAACAAVGVDPVTYSRWEKAYRLHGEAGLIPSQTRSGRKTKFELNEEEQAALRLLRLKKGSLALAVEWFVNEPVCRPETREKILAELDRSARRRRQPVWPPSLRRAGHVTVEEEMLFRGEKHMMTVEHVERKGMFWIDAAGDRQPMAPNVIWESDDMSVNEPFSYVDPATGQLALGRQSLTTLDVFADCYLGTSPVGRIRDAYRVEDIADHMLDTVLQHGLPLMWRLERGVWENRAIDGLDVTHLLGHTPEGDKQFWGGMDALFHIIRTWRSKGKGTIENSFNLLQSLMAHESLSIGRSRGEFEAATKAFLKGKSKTQSQGQENAAAAFWDITACAKGLHDAMQMFNHRPKERRAFGRDTVVPADLYAPAAQQCRELSADDAWRFCPVKSEATIRGGHIETSIPHYPFPFRYRVNGVTPGLYLEHGYGVLIAFHPGRPELGCHVFNAETGTRNRDGYKFGEKIVQAELAADAPQVNLSGSRDGLVPRKVANAAVRKEFRGIVAAGRRAPIRAVSMAQDGHGQSERVERGVLSQRAVKPSAIMPRREASVITDESAELARLEKMEAAARQRGEFASL